MDNNSMDKYIGQLLDNRYEILEVIGQGGMAVVYKAKCHLLNRYVAIKILRDDMAADTEFRERFQKEAQAVAMLSHPNIVSIYDVSPSTDLYYIVMELIDGITLKQYMKTKGALNEKESAHFATQICRALAHAHSKGIVHRDIKPQNIMIGMDGAIKVADFGIAYLENAQNAAGEDGTAVGSVHYISPEQAKGLAPDARSDIYSLGVVMYEMLTGHLPYTGNTAEAVALQHVSSHPKALREYNRSIPEGLELITLRAMNGDINARYQTAQNMLDDLDEYRLSTTSTVIPIISTPPAQPEPAPTPVPAPPNVVEIVDLPRDVRPLTRSGELTKSGYARRRRRSRKISLLSGAFLVVAFIIALFVFLWTYWLNDLFAEPVRIEVEDFVGKSYTDVVNNSEYSSLYTFKITYAIDPTTDEGTIIAQSPEEGKSMMKVPEGIEVTLTLSSGIQMMDMPDIINTDYREATISLEKQGFNVVPEYAPSGSVTKGYVISTNPEPGDRIPAGSTVYVTISSGPTVERVQVPNLVGSSYGYAVSKLESAKLALGTVTYSYSDLPEGTVFWQSIDPYTMVDERTKVYIQVSKGPEEPEETPEPEDAENADGTENTGGEDTAE